MSTNVTSSDSVCFEEGESDISDIDLVITDIDTDSVVSGHADCEVGCMTDLNVFYIYHLASHGSERTLADWLAESGIDIDCQTLDGKTALSLALDGNDSSTADKLRSCGAKVQESTTHMTDYSLKCDLKSTEKIFRSSYFGTQPDFVHTVCRLLHVTVDFTNERGETALTRAVRQDNLRSVITLIDAGAKIDGHVLHLCDSVGSSKCLAPIFKARPSLMLIEFCQCMLFLIMSILYFRNIYFYAS